MKKRFALGTAIVSYTSIDDDDDDLHNILFTKDFTDLYHIFCAMHLSANLQCVPVSLHATLGIFSQSHFEKLYYKLLVYR